MRKANSKDVCFPSPIFVFLKFEINWYFISILWFEILIVSIYRINCIESAYYFLIQIFIINRIPSNWKIIKCKPFLVISVLIYLKRKIVNFNQCGISNIGVQRKSEFTFSCDILIFWIAFSFNSKFENLLMIGCSTMQCCFCWKPENDQ